MLEVIEAIRRKGEHDPGEDPSRGLSRERLHQQEHGEAGERKAGQQDQVVGEDATDVHPCEWRRGYGRQDDGIGKGERATLGIEDVGIEERSRGPWQLVCDPAEPPDAQ